VHAVGPADVASSDVLAVVEGGGDADVVLRGAWGGSPAPGELGQPFAEQLLGGGVRKHQRVRVAGGSTEKSIGNAA
jgi:hypothetical protein